MCHSHVHDQVPPKYLSMLVSQWHTPCCMILIGHNYNPPPPNNNNKWNPMVISLSILCATDRDPTVR